MHVVWHHNKRVQNDIWKMNRNSRPALFNDPTRLVQSHVTVHNVAEAARPLVRADGDEISAGLRIVEIPQPDAVSPAPISICGHDWVGAKNFSPLQISSPPPEFFRRRMERNRQRRGGGVSAHLVERQRAGLLPA